MAAEPARMTEAGTPNFRWNFTVNVLDNMLYALAASLVAQETILPLLVSKLSDSPLLIGLIPALYSISYYLPQLFMANHAEGLRRKLPFVVVFSGFLQRLSIPLIGLCLLLFAESNATMALALFFALFAVSAFGGGIVTPAWYTMIGKVVPVRRRGVFFGIANGGGMLMGVGGALFVGRVLEEVAYPNSFAWLFFVAGGILLVSLVCLALTREPPSEDVKRAGNLRQYLRRLPAILRAQHNYRRYLLSYSLLRVSLMSTSFFVVFGEQSLQLGGAEVGLLVAVFIGTQALLQPLMGSLGDRWGHKRNLSLAALSIVLASGCALLAGDIALVALAVSLLACAISCDSVSQYNIVLEFAPTAEQPTYIGLTNSILAPVTFAAPLLGGWIAAQFGYNALFAASAGAGLVAAWLLLHWVAEPRHNPPAPMFAPTKEKQRRLDMSQAYAANWDSLTKHEVPAWFSDSKFGLYAHWGIYAVPGFGNEWYGKWMYDPNHEIHQRHSERFGNPADFGYKDFIAGFTAEHYDADDWADLFTASGARYAGFSLAHHDGFGLWDSDVYRWNVGKMGPRRDLYGELAAALRRRDMRLVAPFHIVRGFNWFLPGWSQWNQRFDQAAVQRGIDEGWDLFAPDYIDFY
ncbi:MAG: MFS transporter, partial [Chloroflexi bacterium]|nr:MFS transporter [Chloroflexota bacterium]